MESTEGLFAQLESLFNSGVVGPLAGVLFWDLAFWDNAGADTIQLPIVVAWLVFGAIFFTLRFQFVNFRAFRHAIDCVRGVYSKPGETGEISHFQALSAALSATVGLGNIAGVAIAVGVGGPGAVFWMIVAGFLGMSSKFAECTLGQMRPTGLRRARGDGASPRRSAPRPRAAETRSLPCEGRAHSTVPGAQKAQISALKCR